MAFHLTGKRIFGQLLDAKRDTLLVDIDIKDLGLHHVAFVKAFEGGLAGGFPADVRQVHQTIDVVGQTNKQTKFGDVADFALDLGTDRVGLLSDLPTGWPLHCFRPSEIRRFDRSTSSTITSTCWLVETILPG